MPVKWKTSLSPPKEIKGMMACVMLKVGNAVRISARRKYHKQHHDSPEKALHVFTPFTSHQSALVSGGPPSAQTRTVLPILGPSDNRYSNRKCRRILHGLKSVAAQGREAFYTHLMRSEQPLPPATSADAEKLEISQIRENLGDRRVAHPSTMQQAIRDCRDRVGIDDTKARQEDSVHR
jgi:hypothetical protein